MSDTAEETELRMELMRADIDLKRTQARWDGPRVLIAAIAAVVPLLVALAGVVGYLLGRH